MIDLARLVERVELYADIAVLGDRLARIEVQYGVTLADDRVRWQRVRAIVIRQLAALLGASRPDTPMAEHESSLAIANETDTIH
jgi:hypothetical protein